MAELADQRLPGDDCGPSDGAGIDGFGEPDLHAAEVDILRRAGAVARSHQRMPEFSVVQAKLALVVGVIGLSDWQRLAFPRDVLVDEASCRAGLVFLLHLLALLDDLLDPDFLLADSEHVSFLDHVLLGGQALDHDPGLLLGLGVLADHVVVGQFLDLLLLVGLYEVDDRIYVDGVAWLFGLEGQKAVLSVVLDDSGGLRDVDDSDLNAVGLHGVVVEVGVGFLPGLAENLAEWERTYIPSKESGCTTWLSWFMPWQLPIAVI